MEKAAVWRHIHAERTALAVTLAGLPPEDWSHATLCPGWTVHDIAAHVISAPQLGWGDLATMMVRNLGRGYNRMVFREVKRIGARETRETILADYERLATCTDRVPMTTSIEPLIDALVHHQDVVRPLGMTRTMPPDAAAVAADRIRRLSFLMGTRRLVRSVRMSATDVDWTRGSGPTISGPIQELLMICSGREPDRSLVTGDGLVEVR